MRSAAILKQTNVWILKDAGERGIMMAKENAQKAWKKIAAAAVLALMAILAAGSSITGLAKAHGAQEDSYKYYESIRIQRGDTLWDIAAANRNPDYDGIEEYISEIRRLNHLRGDGILAGEYLMIPRYSYIVQAE